MDQLNLGQRAAVGPLSPWSASCHGGLAEPGSAGRGGLLSSESPPATVLLLITMDAVTDQLKLLPGEHPSPAFWELFTK